MRKTNLLFIVAIATLMFTTACNNATKTENAESKSANPEIEKKVKEFASFKLTTDISKLSEKEKQILPLLIDAAEIMDEMFWLQAFGNKHDLLDTIKDEYVRKFAEINYGPWERLNSNEPFIEGYQAKALGSNYYPKDMTVEEFEAFDNEEKASLYTMIRRDENGKLKTIPYSEFFKEGFTKVAELLKKASELAEDEGLKNYLSLRADALLSNKYFESDMAWMDMKTNGLDIVIGPIENYEDALFGYKAANSCYVLVKDKEWSEKLAKYAKLLPTLQKGLPVEDKYKAEKPGSNSDLNAYDVVYYAGDCNAGGKTIAINLPNDEKVQMAKGSRRLQLKNAMKAKFDKIVVPISKQVISKDQQQYIKFNAFFENTMFHEVAHGLGIKNTLDGNGTVRDALKETYSALEEGKADILGLYMITKLKEMGELDVDLMDNYVTFMAGIFRSVRFGGASAHGKANLIRYNFFKEMGAFVRNADGTYTINFDKMKNAMDALSAVILKYQGDGDYEGVKKFVAEKCIINDELKADLERISEANIPIDIVFEQGKQVLGLE